MQHISTSIQSNLYTKNIELLDAKGLGGKFRNWVFGEYDLFLKHEEAERLTVYFPTGKFTIREVSKDYKKAKIEIEVIGRLETECNKIMGQLNMLYRHLLFHHTLNKTN